MTEYIYGMAPKPKPGVLVTAKIRWEGTPDPVGTQLFFFAPAVAAHPLPCFIEELVDGPEEQKNEQVLKIRVLMPKVIAPKSEFKLQSVPGRDRAEGIIQEDT